MADDKNFDEILDGEENLIVEFTDEEGNTFYYVEELIIPVGGDNFAILVAAEPEEHECEDEDCDCDEGDVIIAKIVVNENGEEEYVEPTDEEFEAVQAAYDKMMDDLYHE